jgi:hypothetical protein
MYVSGAMHALVTTSLWGVPGSMTVGKRPRRPHHANNWGSGPGCGWRTAGSGWRCGGRLHALNTRVNTALAAATLVEVRVWQLSRERRSPSVMVRGEPEQQSPVV